jgi:hypothetical protein
MRHEERASWCRDLDTGSSNANYDEFDADVNKGGNLANHDVEGLLSRLDRLRGQVVAPRRPARSPISPDSFEKTRPDSLDDRLPLFLEPAAQTVDDDLRPEEMETEWRDVGRLRPGKSSAHPPAAEMYDAPEMRHRSKFPGLVLLAGAMMVAAAIAGVLVFQQDLVKDLGLFASDIKNRVAGINPAAVQRSNNIAGAFAAIPNVATTAEESAPDADASARAMDRLKQHASTLALARDNRSLPEEAVNSYSMGAPGKSQEGALDVRDSPRANDDAERETAAVAPVAAAPVPSTPSVRRIDPDELAALMKRAGSLIAAGDIAPARLLLERAAEAQDGYAAFLLAQTYDPAVLGTQDMRSITPDPAKARSWYEKAVQFGSEEAQQRLAQMQN